MLQNIHLVIALSTGLIVLYADEQALAWFLGKRELFDPKTTTFLHRAITTGLAALLITGGLLYARAPAAFLSSPLFIVKMVMVFALICNTYFIARFSRIAISHPYAALSGSDRLMLLASGGVSLVGWATAFVSGLLLAGIL